MAKYSTFKYGDGTVYGGTVLVNDIFKVNMADPSYATILRHIKVTVKNTVAGLWNVDTVRLIYANKAHVIPKWLVPVNRLLRRTKVTLKYTTDEEWAVDSLRLHQKIKHRGPSR